MGLSKIIGGHSKGQLMTLVMLIIFILLLAELFAFALLNINSNSISQSLTLTSSSANYGNLFRLSANNFASTSLSKAITTLANYESTPAYRKANFITNTSLYLSYLVTNGVLPNDTSGYPQNAMGNLTLKLYNLSVANVIGFGSQAVTVNETQPLVFQADPYHVSVSYTERIAVNSSGNNFKYTIPVNVSLPLNGTPDLFYSQQGIPSQIRFASIANITSVIGGTTATSGNTLAYGYGTVYWISSSASSGALCSSIPAAISAAAVSGNIVLATYNAIGLETCENSYAGLITYTAPTTLPTVAYLIYPSSSNLLKLIPAGTRVLVYGPALEALNIEGLRSAIANGYYLASPFTPSYLSRARAGFNTQSPNGIFAFSNYNTQSGNFNGAGSYVSVPLSSSLNIAQKITISAWINQASTSGSYAVFAANQLAACSGYTFMVNPYGSAAGNGRPGIGGECTASVQANSVDSPNKWYLVTGTYDGSTYTIYVNGVASNTLAFTQTFTNSGNFFIGELQPGSNLFNGAIANVQVYSSVLSPSQVQQLYQEGISGLPIATANVVGWWPLNGNANDYSGQGNNGAATSVSYNLLKNYSRDSILNTPVPTKLSPIPGILSCTSNSNCATNTIPQLYLGYMPLEMQNGQLQTGNFIAGNYVSIAAANNALASLTYPFTVSIWLRTVTSSNMFLSQGNGVSGIGWYFYVWGGHGLEAGYDNPASASRTYLQESAIPLDDGKWHDVAVTYTSNAANVLMFVDNQQVSYSINGNSIQGSVASTQPLVIGKDLGTGQTYSGYLANLQVYNISLSTNAVNALYASGVAGVPFTANLVGWWPLNGNARDYSGLVHNGTVTSYITYPFFFGTYNAPGLSTIAVSSNEWQALGIPTSS